VRILVWTALLGLWPACATAGAPALVETSAWERGGTSATIRGSSVDSLEVPRNGEVTVRLVSVDARGYPGPSDADRAQVVVRLHTEDGGAVTWRLEPTSPKTAPLRVMGLTRLDVVAGLVPTSGARVSGPAALAEIPRIGALEPGRWGRLARSVNEVGGRLWLAAQLPVHPSADAEPGSRALRLALEGAVEGAEGRVAGAVVVELEIAVEVVDRSRRPEERRPRDRRDDDDPVHKPRPRALASIR
jgi:hypothetical protein